MNPQGTVLPRWVKLEKLVPVSGISEANLTIIPIPNSTGKIEPPILWLDTNALGAINYRKPMQVS